MIEMLCVLTTKLEKNKFHCILLSIHCSGGSQLPPLKTLTSYEKVCGGGGIMLLATLIINLPTRGVNYPGSLASVIVKKSKELQLWLTSSQLPKTSSQNHTGTWFLKPQHMVTMKKENVYYHIREYVLDKLFSNYNGCTCDSQCNHKQMTSI